ncbi:hypothetical protein IFM89_015786 [Coptis chinensis]|uniref:Homeobox domain-containing protein n=1 Tax=Coptis chinensis TaxID=261450 RepID=A0A835MBJ2_9MAGN|nr:hypothetical protein IFM89_015786 [Coptis chinensis]
MSTRKRWSPTAMQLQILESAFNQKSLYYTKEEINFLTTQLSVHGQISKDNIKNWFISRRRVKPKKDQNVDVQQPNNENDPNDHIEVEASYEKCWSATTMQLQILESAFNQKRLYYTKEEIKLLTTQLLIYGQISEDNIKNWFKNRRVKYKKYQHVDVPQSNNENAKNRDIQPAEAHGYVNCDDETSDDNHYSQVSWHDSEVEDENDTNDYIEVEVSHEKPSEVLHKHVDDHIEVEVSYEKRWSATMMHLQILESAFNQKSLYYTKEEIKLLTTQLSVHGQISEDNIKNWFRNHRVKYKKDEHSSQLFPNESGKTFFIVHCYLALSFT